jgi:hypothetical protein
MELLIYPIIFYLAKSIGLSRESKQTESQSALAVVAASAEEDFHD